MVAVQTVNGSSKTVFTTKRKAVHLQNSARGGDKGKGHKWTADSARAAAVKRWKRHPVNKRVGTRLGNPRHRATSLDHKALRLKHAGVPTNGVLFDVWSKKWLRIYPAVIEGLAGAFTSPISERRALQRLGYLKGGRFVPDKWTVSGTYPAKRMA